MDLYAIINFIIQVALISALIIATPIILELLVYMIAAQLEVLINLLFALATFLGFIRTKILENLDSEFCKKPPET
jgi:Na+-transporting NADH:ubiquinone oxidoreductase subunit NqrD